MEKWKLAFLSIAVVFALSACTSDNSKSATNDENPAEIQLTTQVEGIFLGYEGENRVKIEHEGKVETVEVVGEVTGDLDTVKEGDKIAFTTKEVDGKKVLETLRLSE
jgi:Cu/Ag efflux protein CusF